MSLEELKGCVPGSSSGGDLTVMAQEGVEAETRVKIPASAPPSRSFSWVVALAEPLHTLPATGWRSQFEMHRSKKKFLFQKIKRWKLINLKKKTRVF